MFLYSYEADFIQGLLKKNGKKLARSFNFTFRYIAYVLSLNNSRFGDFVDRIYPIELEIKGTRDTDRTWPTPPNWQWGAAKNDDFNFSIVNFPFLCSSLPAAPAYGVYISQLIQYSRACGSYQDFFDRALLLTRKLLNQWFLLVKLKSSLRKFTVVTMSWLTAMEYLCHKWPRICSTCRKYFVVLSPFMTLHRVFY